LSLVPPFPSATKKNKKQQKSPFSQLSIKISCATLEATRDSSSKSYKNLIIVSWIAALNSSTAAQAMTPNLHPAVAAYFEQFSPQRQQILRDFRQRVLQFVPEAHESMAYGMPAYKTQGKPLVYFAAFATHIGFYATPTGHKAFATELAPYKQGKGSVQFPFNQPLPWQLIETILLYRKQQNEQHPRK